MIRALVSGTLHLQPDARASASGKPFTTARLRADGKDGATVWVQPDSCRRTGGTAGGAFGIGTRGSLGLVGQERRTGHVAAVNDSPINEELMALAPPKKATLPEAMAADALEVIGDADWSATLRALNDLRADALGDTADTKAIERMLLAQSVVLQSVFSHYMTRASRSDVLPELQAFADLALKAQNQCRRTLATLAEIRNPRRTQFIKQVNNAVNQQVNNGLAATENRKIPESEPGKVLEVDRAERRRLDVGAAAMAIGHDADVATVGAFHRPTNAGREGPQQQERTQARNARRAGAGLASGAENHARSGAGSPPANLTAADLFSSASEE